MRDTWMYFGGCWKAESKRNSIWKLDFCAGVTVSFLEFLLQNSICNIAQFSLRMEVLSLIRKANVKTNQTSTTTYTFLLD